MKGGQCGLVGGKRRSRRMRGGMYGFSGEAIAPGTLVAGAAYTGNADPKTGAALPDPAMPGGQYSGIGGRRRSRKSRKGSKKSRRGTRKMRGGANQVSAVPAAYGFSGGTVTSGPPDATPVSTRGGNAF
jgi:hypothetical protein